MFLFSQEMTDLVVYDSPLNPVAIRESTLGSYLESINTGGTWFQHIQETLGFEPKPLTALDVAYAASGIAGIALLVPLAVGAGAVSIPLVAAGSALVAVSAVGLSEEDRRTKIGAGIAGGALVVWKPGVAAFIVKEAYSGTKETLKQSVELAKTGIGFTTSLLGFGTALVGGTILYHNTNKKRKKPSS